MRRDYIFTNFNAIKYVSWLVTLLKPKYKIKKSSGFLGQLSNKDVDDICEILNKDGCYVLNEKIPLTIVNEILNYAKGLPLNYLKSTESKIEYSKDTISFEMSKDKSIRFEPVDISVISSCPHLIDLTKDPNFLHIANNYLGTKPILDLILFWWSTSFQELNVSDSERIGLKNAAAQMYHFDMDRLKFLKFFIYLTDVDEFNGPHMYVKKTHNKCPKYIRNDGRYSDSFIEENACNDIVEITGKAGTIIIADTRGIHKGKELEKGERLIFQLEFANSDFGKPEFQMISSKFNSIINERFKYSYAKYFNRC
jgi:hypothetical protein